LFGERRVRRGSDSSELNGPFVEFHRAPRTVSVEFMDSSGRFSSRKHNLLYDALHASGQSSGDYSDFNRCMSEAKSKGLTWVQGLDYTVKKLQPAATRESERKPAAGLGRLAT